MKNERKRERLSSGTAKVQILKRKRRDETVLFDPFGCLLLSIRQFTKKQHYDVDIIASQIMSDKEEARSMN